MDAGAADHPPITRVQMLPMFVSVLPSFLHSWQRFLSEWDSESDPPLYLALSDLARHLIEKLSRGDTAQFPALFAVVERCHVHGDDYVREAVTIRLLEDLQNRNLHATTTPSEFEVWLEPRSRDAWRSLNRFWAGEIPFVGGSGPAA